MKIIFPLMLLFAVGFPVILAAVWIKKTGAKTRAVLVGALIFFVFVEVLESLLHAVCLASDNAVSRLLNSNAIAYGIYGGLAAGIFEETGRFFAYKTLLRRLDGRETAVAYGIGHGGMEVVLLLGVFYTMYTLAAFSPSLGSGALASVMPSVQAIMESPYLCLIAVWERVFAVMLHVALSIFVFRAARDRSKLRYFPLAILLHALVDFPAALCQQGMISVYALEIIVALYSTVLMLFARKVYMDMGNNKEEE